MILPFLKKSNPKIKAQTNRHFVFIEIPFKFVAPYAIQWGEGAWWPEKCPLRFVRESLGETHIGSRFRLEWKNKQRPAWLMEVTNYIPNHLREHTFKSGMITGKEVITIGERANGTRIDYELHYQIRGLLNTLLWPLVYRSLHDRNIELIMQALRQFVVKEYQLSQEKPKPDERKENL